MKEELVIINVMMIDDKAVELTCGTIVHKKMQSFSELDINKDPMQLHQEMLQCQPKINKVVVSRDFYDRKNLNIYKTINIEVS